MPLVTEIDEDQERWNEYGRRMTERIRRDPSAHQISVDRFPMPYRFDDEQVAELRASLGDLTGKRVLELGCGYGRFAVYLAKLGADVTAVDLGYDLVYATRVLAEVNDAACQVAQVDIEAIPFAPGSFDVVVGIAVLHHMSVPDVARVVRDVERVLVPGGRAYFYETVEDSRLFNAAQKLLPAGRAGSEHYRPSVLNRPAWRAFVAQLDEREMTSQEFRDAGSAAGFVQVSITPYGLTNRLERLRASWKAPLSRLDSVLLRRVAPLRRLARFAMVEYRKAG